MPSKVLPKLTTLAILRSRAMALEDRIERVEAGVTRRERLRELHFSELKLVDNLSGTLNDARGAEGNALGLAAIRRIELVARDALRRQLLHDLFRQHVQRSISREGEEVLHARDGQEVPDLRLAKLRATASGEHDAMLRNFGDANRLVARFGVVVPVDALYFPSRAQTPIHAPSNPMSLVKSARALPTFTFLL